ncbi:MAG: ABC transporter permease [Bacteroidota bacterium]|nr:ABC transporter permease [Bacteroidota bacterium]MDP4214072.1 ABC transporter permease [Bacteroidota bacterium]MDP4251573.1 ABC transporter permease [Bacteroidota bacterium]
MLKNYFKIAYRTLLKNKAFSFLNIFGLAIGMAACFFIFQYVHFEKSYDRFNKNADNLYRVTISYSGSFSNLLPMATNHPAVAPAMKTEFPEVVNETRLVDPILFVTSLAISYKDHNGNMTSFNEGKMYIADSSFFSMFSFPLLAGNPATVLSQPNSIVISQTAANKYFGKENPVGKTVYLNQRLPLAITGVFKDAPENSHLKFDMLISFKTIDNDNGMAGNWTWPEFYNYVQLAPGTDPKKVEAKFPAFIEKHLAAVLRQFSFGCAFHLQRITDIHLRSALLKEPEVNGSEKEIYFLTIIGIFILTIAWINYINLSTAKSAERAKEVGLRKVVGGRRWQLMGQFITESFIVNLFALAVAALIVVCCFPFFEPFVGKNMSNVYSSEGIWNTAGFWLLLLAIFIIGAFLVGAYPALVLSSFKPVDVLKGKFSRSGKGIFLRKALVSFQFILSLLLIGGSVTVYRQLDFMRNQELGYNKDQVLVIKAPAIFDSLYANKITLFRSQLASNPAVNSITLSSDIPGRSIIERNSVRKTGEDASHNFITSIMEIDENFIRTFQVKLVAGRNFRPDDTVNLYQKGIKNVPVIINESLAKGLGFPNAEAAQQQTILLQYAQAGGITCQIIGVLKDYHQRSLKENFDPIIYYAPSNHGNSNYFVLNVNTHNLQHDLATMKGTYNNIFSGTSFDYFFLSDYFNAQYQADQQFGKVFGLFTMLAIFIACLGLLGLSSFMIRLRTKEIGIRRVLGASVYSILALFSRDFVRMICLASVVAIPVIYYLAYKWLSNYAFHIGLGWYIFIVPPLLLIIISLVITVLQSTKAALNNPVNSLKTE